MATPASASNATLTVDFDQSRFSTRLQLGAGAVSAVLDAQGKVYSSGDFSSSVVYSNGVVKGVLGGQGGMEAGYLYQTNVDGNRQFLGATSWRR